VHGDFRARVQRLSEVHDDAPASAYAASTEMGGIEFVRDGGIRINGRVAKLDKFSRAIPVAAAWNAGKILLPRSAPWLDAFVSEVCGFTGVKDRHDDQVDALAAAFDELHDGGGPMFAPGEAAQLDAELAQVGDDYFTSHWSGSRGFG
jgi:predicted phage terminase large subunit-like protein